MNFVYLAIISFTQLLIGYDLLALLNIKLSRIQQLSLSMITGIAITSLIPCTLQLLYIPLTGTIIFSTLGVLCFLLSILNFKHLRQMKFNWSMPKIEVYELPWLGIVLFLMGTSFYFTFFMAPTPRDLLSGPEPIAEFALREHTFINTVYNQDMPLNNGPFKSLYIPSLQLIYKLIGFPFGKTWIGILAISFTMFLYSHTRSIINPLLAGIIMTVFMFATELYAYTYLVLYDYSNMVFYFLSLYFLHLYLNTHNHKFITFSIFLIGIATYIRPETLIISAFISTFGIVRIILNKQRSLKVLSPIALMTVCSAVVYFFTSYLYLNHYLPVLYDVSNTINSDLTNLTPLFKRLYQILDELIFSEYGVMYWGYIFHIFVLLTVAEVVVYKKLNRNNILWLSMLLVTYFSIAFMGYLLPLADLANTSKRALFKIIPIVVLCLANNGLVLKSSEKITTFLKVKPMANLGKKKRLKRAKKKVKIAH